MLSPLFLRSIKIIVNPILPAKTFFGFFYAFFQSAKARYGCSKEKRSDCKLLVMEIVRRMSTQKAITTEGVNALGDKVNLRLCSEPNKAAQDIYQRLRYKPMPFRRIQIPQSL